MLRDKDDAASKDGTGTFPGWENLGGGDVGRRTLIKGAAWTAPVIALTVATPLAAASPTTTMDIAVTTMNTVGGFAFAEPAATSQDGQSVWNDNQTLHNYVRIENLGTETIPAGSTFTVTYPNSGAGALQMFSNPNISSFPTSTTPGISTSTVVPVGPATVTNGVVSRTYTVGVAIPPGTGFTTQFSSTVLAKDVGIYQSLHLSSTAQLPAGQTDANPSNDSLVGTAFSIAGSQSRDLAVTSLGTAAGYAFNEASARVQNGEAVWLDNQTLHHYVRIQNTGNQGIPAGSILTLTYPNSGSANLQMFSGTSISEVRPGTTPGISTSTVTPTGPATVSNGVVTRSFLISAPLPAGADFTLVMATPINNMSPGIYTGKHIQGTITPPSGTIDTNPGNNSLTGPIFSIAGS